MMNDGNFRYGWYIVGSKLYIDIYMPDLVDGDVAVSIDEANRQRLSITVKGVKNMLDLCGDVFDPVINIKPTKTELSFKITNKVVFTHLLKSEAEAAKKHDRVKRYHDMDLAGENDAPNDLMTVIRDIYQNGNDDTKRAMLKSYQESCGTVLSTNWNEVKAGPVRPQLPA